jgi:hypothetical protein
MRNAVYGDGGLDDIKRNEGAFSIQSLRVQKLPLVKLPVLGRFLAFKLV